VSIVRVDGAHVDVLVLGDSPVIVGPIDEQPEMVVDDRLSRLANPYRAEYRRRLADGHGYDEPHRAMLREMQTIQAAHRNRAEGYFIAETDPNAADHAITRLPVLYDPATLLMAFDRVAGNQRARPPGVDGLTVADVEETVGVPGFLDDLRAALKGGSFRPLPVRERKIRTFKKLDTFTWWRLVHMLRARHGWNLGQLRRHLTTATGRWQIAADGVEYFRIEGVTVSRYTYRGNKRRPQERQ